MVNGTRTVKLKVTVHFRPESWYGQFGLRTQVYEVESVRTFEAGLHTYLALGNDLALNNFGTNNKYWSEQDLAGFSVEEIAR